jgi:hypothetical protein
MTDKTTDQKDLEEIVAFAAALEDYAAVAHELLERLQRLVLQIAQPEDGKKPN